MLSVNDLSELLTKSGVLTTVGAPAALIMLFAKITGRIRLNWYTLAPILQAYTVLLCYLLIFGTVISSPIATIAFVSLGGVLSAIIFSAGIGLFASPMASLSDAASVSRVDAVSVLRALLGWFIVIAIAFFPLLGSVYGDCHGPRCDAFGLVFGYSGYAGSLMLPVLLISGITTALYVRIFVTKSKVE